MNHDRSLRFGTDLLIHAQTKCWSAAEYSVQYHVIADLLGVLYNQTVGTWCLCIAVNSRAARELRHGQDDANAMEC
jgi:hypothetical protein